MNFLIRCLLVSFVGISFTAMVMAAPPMAAREWTSTAGTNIRAEARSLENGIVELVAGQRVMRVPLLSLIASDQAVLQKHFAAAPASSVTAPPSLSQPTGKAVGPIRAAEGSSYFLYIPKSVVAGRAHPLMVILSPGGGSAGSLDPYLAGAERNGWILIVSVESSNNLPWNAELPSVTNALNHAKASLPVDPERIFITGFSGGSSGSFHFAGTVKVAGVMACGMGSSYGTKLDKDMPIYFLNGTNCWNRRDAGSTIARHCPKSKDTRVRFYPGEHVAATSELFDEGMTFLNYVILHRHRDKYRQEASQAEASIVQWAESLKTSKPECSLTWTTFLQTRTVDPKNAPALNALHQELLKNPKAVKWLQGLNDIQDVMVNDMGKDVAKDFGIAWSSYNKKYQKLLDAYGDSEWKATLEAMLLPAQKASGGNVPGHLQ